jgi:WD40 repeat protein
MEFPVGRSKVAFFAFAFVALVLASYAGAQRSRAVFSTECGGNVNSAAFGPDGQTLASGGLGGKILLWDVASKSSAARIMAF